MPALSAVYYMEGNQSLQECLLHCMGGVIGASTTTIKKGRKKSLICAIGKVPGFHGLLVNNALYGLIHREQSYHSVTTILTAWGSHVTMERNLKTPILSKKTI